MTHPKLHIRDLFWLVLVCAMATGWSLQWYRTGDGLELQREREVFVQQFNSLEEQLESEGYTINWSSIGPFLERKSASP